jgi:hypothetical protein
MFPNIGYGATVFNVAQLGFGLAIFQFLLSISYSYFGNTNANAMTLYARRS